MAQQTSPGKISFLDELYGMIVDANADQSEGVSDLRNSLAQSLTPDQIAALQAGLQKWAADYKQGAGQNG